MSVRLRIAALGLIAGIALSGCFSLREINWTKDRIAPGETTKARISLQPSGGGKGSISRLFLMVVTSSTDFDGFGVGPAAFDTREVLGPRKKLILDQLLAQEIVDEGLCDDLLPSPPSLQNARVFRTQGNVSSDTRRFIQATLRLKMRAAAEGGFFGSVLTGLWDDDGDGVPEGGGGDDGLTCTGGASTSVIKRGG